MKQILHLFNAHCDQHKYLLRTKVIMHRWINCSYFSLVFC